MTTNIYFVRHAEPDFSIKDDLARPLTQKGMQDTVKVTRALKDRDIFAIYSSPCRRAVETVSDLSQKIGIEIKICDNLCERVVGEWVEDFKAYSKRQWEDFDYKLSGGESLRETQKRNISSLFKLLDGNEEKNIVIGTHGTALSTIINYFDPGFGYDNFWSIVDKMPYILCFRFNQMELDSIDEINIDGEN